MRNVTRSGPQPEPGAARCDPPLVRTTMEVVANHGPIFPMSPSGWTERGPSKPEYPRSTRRERAREETAEAVLAGPRNRWRQLHCSSRRADSWVSRQGAAATERGAGLRRSSPQRLMDLLRWGRLLGTARCEPGLAANDSGHSERRGRNDEPPKSLIPVDQ